MRDLHEVIDLDAFLNPRTAKPGPVNRRVRADLDIVIDLNKSELLKFFLAAIDHLKSKSVCANHRAAVNNHAQTNAGSLADRYSRINQACRSNYRFMTDVAPRADDRIVTDLRASFDHSMRLDRHPLSELGAWIDNHGWMNPGRKCNRLRGQFQHDLLEGFCRICDTNLSGRDRLGKIRRNENGGSAGFTQESDIFSIGEKTDLPGGCFYEGRSAGDFQPRVADQLAAGHCRQFLKGKSHWDGCSVKEDETSHLWRTAYVSASSNFRSSVVGVYR